MSSINDIIDERELIVNQMAALELERKLLDSRLDVFKASAPVTVLKRLKECRDALNRNEPRAKQLGKEIQGLAEVIELHALPNSNRRIPRRVRKD